jgi:hypothetical protein
MGRGEEETSNVFPQSQAHRPFPYAGMDWKCPRWQRQERIRGQGAAGCGRASLTTSMTGHRRAGGGTICHAAREGLVAALSAMLPATKGATCEPMETLTDDAGR